MFGFGGKSFNADIDIPDLSGKVILVTGGMYKKLGERPYVDGASAVLDRWSEGPVLPSLALR